MIVDARIGNKGGKNKLPARCRHPLLARCSSATKPARDSEFGFASWGSGGMEAGAAVWVADSETAWEPAVVVSKAVTDAGLSLTVTLVNHDSSGHYSDDSGERTLVLPRGNDDAANEREAAKLIQARHRYHQAARVFLFTMSKKQKRAPPPAPPSLV